jgi:hypothetical protein
MQPFIKSSLSILFVLALFAGAGSSSEYHIHAASLLNLATQQYIDPPSPTSLPTQVANPVDENPLSQVVEATPTAAPEVIYTYGPDDFPSGINPLTGLPLDDPARLERRPIAIKITNFPRSVRPQWGLTLADHVYEYYIGDLMTRFIGIFYGNDAYRVGPVRSARLFDEYVMRMYKAFFVFGYADFRVRDELFDDDLKSFLIFETPRNCPPVCRYENNLSYNNLYADTAGLHEYFARKSKNDQRQNQDGLLFDIHPPAGGQAADSMSIYYTMVSYHRWEFAPQQGRYLRIQELQDDRGQTLLYAPLVDSLSQQQASANNVVVLYVPHETYYESSSTLILDMPVDKFGQGYALRDGRIYPLIWLNLGADRLWNLYLTNGEPYPLKPGNVWFEIIGESSQIEQHGKSDWQFNFGIP